MSSSDLPDNHPTCKSCGVVFNPVFEAGFSRPDFEYEEKLVGWKHNCAKLGKVLERSL